MVLSDTTDHWWHCARTAAAVKPVSVKVFSDLM
jgi:hypothetical protein